VEEHFSTLDDVPVLEPSNSVEVEAAPDATSHVDDDQHASQIYDVGVTTPPSAQAENMIAMGIERWASVHYD
jgi:hypothetical protein